MPDTFTLYAPFDRRPLGEFTLSDWAAADAALTAAARLHAAGSPLPKYRRLEILENLAAAMLREREHLARIAAEEGGKPWNDTLVEIGRAIQGVKYAAAALQTLAGEEIPMELTPASAGKLACTIREPAGVILAISAFNHPVNLIIHQVIPAVAAGCPAIVKPALTTPRSCLRVVELLYEAGLPPEWCRVILCDNDTVGRMAADGRIAFLNFIGSARVGWRLRSNLAPGVRCALEHGGAAPVIVDETADVRRIAPLLAKGGFYHAGQVCVSVQRVFAAGQNAAALAEEIAAVGRSYTVGNPLLPATDVGPLITPAECSRVGEWVREAESGGGVIVGNYPENRGKLSETCFAPTVLLDPPDDARISREEVFGPVIAVYACATADEAVARANNMRYAFQAAVFTENLRAALDMAKRLNASAVMLNDHTAFRTDWMPFGGRGESGLGTGGIGRTLRDYTQEKLLVFAG